MKKYIAVFLTITLTVTAGFSQSRSERKKEKQKKLDVEYAKTKALIASKNFQFVAEWANPLGNDVSNITSQLPGGGAGVFQGNRVNLIGHPNFVKIDGETANISLPYFGRAFIADLDDTVSGGIKFEGEIDKYRIKENSNKKRLDIRFTSKYENESNDYQFTINPDGTSVLTVSSNRRQTISYNGIISEIEAKLN